MTTLEQTIARNVLARLEKQNPTEEWDLSELTEDEIDSLISGEPMTDQMRARLRRVPARVNVLSELTEEEIDNILARHPPLKWGEEYE